MDVPAFVRVLQAGCTQLVTLSLHAKEQLPVPPTAIEIVWRRLRLLPVQSAYVPHISADCPF